MTGRPPAGFDYDGDVLSGARHRPPRPVDVPLRTGLTVEVRGDPFVGAVRAHDATTVTLANRAGRVRVFRRDPGGFVVDGRVATLVDPPPRSAPVRTTRSGSIATPAAPARVARAGRIWVEGLHDAELVEHVWGDDLRWVGVVVEPIGGADDLPALVRDFRPAPDRRLGVLLDHLRPGTKEHAIAGRITHRDVLVRGHRHVDVWAALDPGLVGRDAWPDVPLGEDWKSGVLRALGHTDDATRFWRNLLRRVEGLRDLDRGLVRAVEELIDFVAPGDV